jgi:hypothetical protein
MLMEFVVATDPIEQERDEPGFFRRRDPGDEPLEGGAVYSGPMLSGIRIPGYCGREGFDRPAGPARPLVQWLPAKSKFVKWAKSLPLNYHLGNADGER